MVYPAVLFSAVVLGISLAILVTQGVLCATILSVSPYNKSPAQVGVTQVAPLVATLIASPLAGLLSDKLVKILGRRNAGIYEPEFRLLIAAIFVPLSTTSLIGMGYAVDNHAPFLVVVAVHAVQSFAFPFAAQASMAYVMDCHPDDQNQAYVAIGLVKSSLIFTATSIANGLYTKHGPVRLFNSLAIVNLMVLSTTVPLYVYGKRFRSMVSISRFSVREVSTNTPEDCTK